MEKLIKYKKSIFLTSIITLLPIIIGSLLWNRLPDEIATHFSLNGDPNGWASKFFTVFGLPVFLLFCHLLCIIITCADPKKQQIGDGIFKLILWLIPAISVVLSFSIYGYELGYQKNMADWTILFIGALFIVIGTFLPKCQQNYTVGIKLPWTLHDEDNWNCTHKLTGKLWIVGGIAFVIFAVADIKSSWSIAVVIGIMTVIPVFYSFLYYIKQNMNLS